MSDIELPQTQKEASSQALIVSEEMRAVIQGVLNIKKQGKINTVIFGLLALSFLFLLFDFKWSNISYSGWFYSIIGVTMLLCSTMAVIVISSTKIIVHGKPWAVMEGYGDIEKDNFEHNRANLRFLRSFHEFLFKSPLIAICGLVIALVLIKLFIQIQPEHFIKLATTFLIFLVILGLLAINNLLQLRKIKKVCTTFGF